MNGTTPEEVYSLREEIHRYIERAGTSGVTDADIEVAFKNKMVGCGRVRDHRRVLVQNGRIFDSGHKRIATNHRVPSTIWLSNAYADRRAGKVRPFSPKERINNVLPAMRIYYDGKGIDATNQLPRDEVVVVRKDNFRNWIELLSQA